MDAIVQNFTQWAIWSGLVQWWSMFDFYQRRKLRTIVNSPVTQGLLLLLVVYIGWSAFVRYDIAMEMYERRLAAEAQLATLQERKEELTKEVHYLESERGIEAEMRRQFDVALPGEQVVVIVEEEESDEPKVMPLSTSSPEENERRWYQFWE